MMFYSGESMGKPEEMGLERNDAVPMERYERRVLCCPGSFRLNRAGQAIALQAIAVKLCRLLGADHHQRLAVYTRLQHNLDGLINRQALDCSQERVNHKIHRVHIVVMQQHAIAREQTQQLFDILAGECIGLGTHELFLHRSKREDQSSFSNYSNRPGYPCLAFWEKLAMAPTSQQFWRQRQRQH